MLKGPAQQYQQYNKLRALLSNHRRSPKPTKRNAPPAQPIPPEAASAKRQKLSQPVHPAILDPYDSPRSIHRTPVHLRTCIGPTPQKDGRVLGLFDLLSPASGSLKTPSKRSFLGIANPNAFATPTKRLLAGEFAAVEGKQSTGKKPARSPISASKRTYLDSFLTPLAQRLGDRDTPASKSGISKIQFDSTPTFLRRDSQRGWTEHQGQLGAGNGTDNAVSWSPVAVRKRPRLAGRGLSTLVKGLRDMEDKKLDEEMDMLREMEAAEDTIVAPGKMSKQPAVFVEDSQVLDMPLGPDGVGASDDDLDEYENEGKGRDGRPLKVWKKKGQKRTTRKTNMKPNNAKWKPEPKWQGTKDDNDAADGLAAVAETQLVGPAEKPLEQPGEDDNMEYLEEDSWSEVEDLSSTKAKPKAKDKPTKSRSDAAPKTKKVSATAHANYRALKIKNKQSKGKRGSRFGKGRR